MSQYSRWVIVGIALASGTACLRAPSAAGQGAPAGAPAAAAGAHFKLPAVYTDLDLTDEQRAALQDVFAQAADRSTAVYHNAGLTPGERTDEVRAIVAAREQKIKDILTLDQQEALALAVRQEERDRISHDRLVTLGVRVKLTPLQMHQVEPILQNEDVKADEIRGTDRTLTPRQVYDLAELHRTTMEAVRKLLTPDQQTLLDAYDPPGPALTAPPPAAPAVPRPTAPVRPETPGTKPGIDPHKWNMSVADYPVPAIYDAVGLDPAQRRQIQEIYVDCEKREAILFWDSKGTKTNPNAQVQALFLERQARLAAVLRPEQAAALEKLRHDEYLKRLLDGNVRLLADMFKLTADQQVQITPAVETELVENEKVQGASVQPTPDQRAKLAAIHDVAMAAIRKFLTPDQAAVLDRMMAARHKPESPAPPPATTPPGQPGP